LGRKIIEWRKTSEIVVLFWDSKIIFSKNNPIGAMWEIAHSRALSDEVFFDQKFHFFVPPYKYSPLTRPVGGKFFVMGGLPKIKRD
jgi:hypothetical protein